MTTRLILPFFSACLLVACGHHAEPSDARHDLDAASEGSAADLGLSPLACGCALEEVGVCGEYIEIEGEFVELVPPMDLGSMPFCHKQGLLARVEGEMQDGRFVASSFALAD